MRRKEKQIIDRKELDAVIHTGVICHMAMVKENMPYLIPLSYGYDGASLYLHTADSGKKIDFIEANNQVCFAIEHQVQLISDDKRACKWSFSFKSVIGNGTISELVDPFQKEYGLVQIMRHYSKKEWQFDDKAMAKTRIWKISIQSLRGKRSLD